MNLKRLIPIALIIPLACLAVRAQAPSRPGVIRTTPTGSGAAGKESAPGVKPKDAIKPASQPPKSSAPAQPAASSNPAAAGTAPVKSGETAAAPEEGKKAGWIQQLVQWIIQYSLWIVVVTGSVLAGVLVYFFIAGRGAKVKQKESAAPAPARAAGRRDDDDGPRRILIDRETGKPLEKSSRDDSEYALVVNKADLELGEGASAEAHGDKQTAGEGAIAAAVEKEDFEGAFARYTQWVHDNTGLVFRPDLERRMGKFFLKQQDFEKAAFILEHHVATQPASLVEPEIYFDLGYIHFKRKTINKCRRFFKLFADKESNTGHNQRARNLLSRLDRMTSLD